MKIVFILLTAALLLPLVGCNSGTELELCTLEVQTGPGISFVQLVDVTGKDGVYYYVDSNPDRFEFLTGTVVNYYWTKGGQLFSGSMKVERDRLLKLE